MNRSYTSKPEHPKGLLCFDYFILTDFYFYQFYFVKVWVKWIHTSRDSMDLDLLSFCDKEKRRFAVFKITEAVVISTTDPIAFSSSFCSSRL